MVRNYGVQIYRLKLNCSFKGFCHTEMQCAKSYILISQMREEICFITCFHKYYFYKDNTVFTLNI